MRKQSLDGECPVSLCHKKEEKVEILLPTPKLASYTGTCHILAGCAGGGAGSGKERNIFSTILIIQINTDKRGKRHNFSCGRKLT